jgi:Zn-dependent protease with chaperone function/Tfp pilus assembly major pilin PilA
MKAQELRTETERILYIASIIISIIVWIAVAVTVVGLLYCLLFGFIFFAAHALMIAHIKGSAIKLSEAQLPGVHSKVVEACKKLGIDKIPDAYIMQAGGALNAFATKFIGRNFIVLYSDLLEACDENSKEMDMVIGHEVGHLALGHLKLIWLLFPARLVPWLGPALSRAREYSCDLCGYEVVGELEPAVKGLAILAAGGKYGRQVNIDSVADQIYDTSGFWTSVYELNAGHPFLTKRIAALVNHKKPGTAALPGRNVFAYPLAPLFSFSFSAGAGSIVAITIIAMLAAIAIPQFASYRAKAEKAAIDSTLRQTAVAAEQYKIATGNWPCSLDELKLTEVTTMAKAKNWDVKVNCQYRAAAIFFKDHDGTQHYRVIHFDNGKIEDGRI